MTTLLHRARNFVHHHFSALAAMGVRGAGVAAAFVVTILIGRWYGPVANAQYALVTQTAMFLSVIAVGGADLAVTREFSRAVAERRKLARGNLWRIIAQTCAAALALSVLVMIGGEHILKLIGRDTLPAGSLAVMCAILLARAFTRIGAAVLRSQGDYVLSQAIELFLIPVITIALIVIGLARTLPGFLWATAGAGLATALLGIGLMERHTTGSGGIEIDARAVYRMALPLWGVTVLATFSDWFSLATISAVNGLEAAGLFRVAIQFASAFAIISLGLFGTFASQISAAYHAADMDRVGRLCRSATVLCAAIVVPALLVAVIFAPQLVGVVGPKFRDAAPMLRILAVGQAIYAITGISGLALALLGRPVINLYIDLTIVTVIVTGGPIAASLFGPEAMCVFVASAMGIRNLAALMIVKRIVGLNVLTGKR